MNHPLLFKLSRLELIASTLISESGRIVVVALSHHSGSNQRLVWAFNNIDTSESGRRKGSLVESVILD